MELNHQIRLCRPFPFLFGFRAILKTSGNSDSKGITKVVPRNWL
jgi:hypothetical protein